MVAQGEKVFNSTCATGYCHGTKGVAAGAPRLAARGFDRAYIETTVSRGISGTAMPAFATVLDRGDLAAVVTYVSSLNGNAGATAATGSQLPLPAEAARGRELFFEATRGFARCATCHEVGGFGLPVTTSIARVPANVEALRGLATPDVRTAVAGGESMPALVVSEGKHRVIFYDLTTAPPVLRTEDPAAVRITEGAAWKHSSATGSYSDAELAAILAYLKAAVH